MVAADGEALVVVLPRGNEEELTALAGFHALASWFGKVGETVLLKDDEGKVLLESDAHDGFLSFGDAGRDEDGSAAGLSEERFLACGDFFVGEAARALHLQTHRGSEEEAVADGRALHSANYEVALHSEVVGVLALHEQAARVVAQIVEPSLQLTLAQEQLVVEARGKEEAVGTVVGMGGWLRLSRLFCLFCLLL